MRYSFGGEPLNRLGQALIPVQATGKLTMAASLTRPQALGREGGEQGRRVPGHSLEADGNFEPAHLGGLPIKSRPRPPPVTPIDARGPLAPRLTRDGCALSNASLTTAT